MDKIIKTVRRIGHNPDLFPDDVFDLLVSQGPLKPGETLERGWNSGRTKNIPIGSRVYLLRQGQQGRGIYASGRTIGQVVQGPHWEFREDKADYVPVDWGIALDPEDALETETLQERFPEANWTPRSSGVRIRNIDLDELEAFWRAHVDEVEQDEFDDHTLALSELIPETGENTSKMQGFFRKSDAKIRKQMERYAQSRLEEHFRSRGWKVEDMSRRNPFDAIATKDKSLLLQPDDIWQALNSCPIFAHTQPLEPTILRP